MFSSRQSREFLKLNQSSIIPATEYSKDPFLTPKEQQIVDSVSDHTISRLSTIKVNNISDKKSDIIAFRTEDLISFIKILEEGFFNLDKPSFMNKEKGFLYATANPESSDLKRHSVFNEIAWEDLLAQTSPSSLTFNSALLYNDKLYNKLPIVAALSRDFIPNLTPRLSKIFNEIDTMHSLNFDFEDVRNLESLNELLAIDIMNVPWNQEDYLKHFTKAAWIIMEQFDLHDRQIIRDFFGAISMRAGVFIAFNKTILQYLPSADKAETAYEVLFEDPSNRIPSDCILGFELLGTWEEQVLENIIK